MSAAEELMKLVEKQQKEWDDEVAKLKEKHSKKIAKLREAAQLVCEHPDLRDDSYVDPHKGTLENWFFCKTCHKVFTSEKEANGERI